MTRRPVRGVVLAGGDSTRFEAGDKALARVEGTPMLRRVADVLRGATGRPPAVAAGDPSPAAYRDVLPGDAVFVPDAGAFWGPLAGLVGAARGLDEPWLVVAACDMPRLDAATVSWLVDARSDDADAVLAVDADNVPQPLCACYRRAAVLDAVDGDGLMPGAGIHALFGSLETRVLTPGDAPDDVDLDTALANVNTVDALDSLELSD